jgi:hypothetical protein
MHAAGPDFEAKGYGKAVLRENVKGDFILKANEVELSTLFGQMGVKAVDMPTLREAVSCWKANPTQAFVQLETSRRAADAERQKQAEEEERKAAEAERQRKIREEEERKQNAAEAERQRKIREEEERKAAAAKARDPKVLFPACLCTPAPQCHSFCRLLPPLASKANPASSMQRKAATCLLFGTTSPQTLLALAAEMKSECRLHRAPCRRCYDAFVS